MNIYSRRLKYAIWSVAVSIVVSLPVTVVFNNNLGSAVFGAFCIFGFLFHFHKFKFRPSTYRIPIAMGVVFGIVLQFNDSMPMIGYGTVIFFTGVGSILAMFMGSMGETASEGRSVKNN